MYSPKISIIIPMYNCEQYVEDVLSMFAEQSFSDFEAICVIDGATDNTQEIVEAFCKKDNRFRFYQQDNEGAGAARNTGFQYATGKYIIWADADDTYSKHFLASMYEVGETHNAEIVMCLFSTKDYLTGNSFRSGFNSSVFQEGKVYAHNEINNLASSIVSRVTNKMYNREFILSSRIKFSESIICNDIFFNFATMFSANRISTVHQVLLEYRMNINQESLTSKRSAHLPVVLSELRKIYTWIKDRNKLKDHLTDYYAIFNNSVYYSYSFDKDEDFLQRITDALNTEKPWCTMRSEEIIAHVGDVIFASKAIEKLKALKCDHSLSSKEQERRLRNQVNSAEIIRKRSLVQYGRDFENPDSMPMPEWAPRMSSLQTQRSLIVSFTSFPARIAFVPQVLDSLYRQSLQADRILLWLAEEQFPDKEDNLPEALQADIKAGKVEVRWCDDIGSHKKYFYTMQEFSEDIVVTIDDDMDYHPDTIKALYKSYLRYPQAVSALQTSLVLFDEAGNIMPPNTWLYDFKQLQEPTLQLMAVGVGGVLYPPGCIDRRVFDKDAILKNLYIEDTYTSDDEWLKIHEVFAGTPVVLASDSILLHHIQGTTESALSKKTRFIEHVNVHFDAIRQHYARGGTDEVTERFQDLRHEANYLPDDAHLCYDLCTADLEQKIALLTSDLFFGDSIESVLPTFVRRNVTMMSRQMARDYNPGGEKEYVSRIRDALLTVEGIEDIARRDFPIGAIIEHEAVLRATMWGAFRSREDYRQMLYNWECFMESHPDCRPVYLEKYYLFLKDMKNAGYASDALIDLQHDSARNQVLPAEQDRDGLQPNNKVPAKVSVIIPVHNAGSYIAKCIESLQTQTIRELEFIFVDDCSSDESMNAVKEWAAFDPRVVILRNEHNLGEGGSRNRGIEAARGLYVNTIDPDDWVAPNYYELLWAKAVETSADIVKGTRIKIDAETQKEVQPRSNLNTRIERSLKMGKPLYTTLAYEHQAVIYKKSILDDTVRYGKSANAGDVTFLLRLCKKAESFALEEKAFYYYLQRTDSATAGYSLRRSKNELVSFTEHMDCILQDEDVDAHAYRYCAAKLVVYITGFIHAYEEGKVTQSEKKQYIADLKKQILRLPEYERLYESKPEFYALVEQDCLLSPRLYEDIQICKEQMSEWIAYILALDDKKREAAHAKLEELFTDFLKERKQSGASIKTFYKEMRIISSGLVGIQAKMEFYSLAGQILEKHKKSLSRLLFKLPKVRSHRVS